LIYAHFLRNARPYKDYQKREGVRSEMKAVHETMALNRVLSLSSRAHSQSANFCTEDAGSRFF